MYEFIYEDAGKIMFDDKLNAIQMNMVSLIVAEPQPSPLFPQTQI